MNEYSHFYPNMLTFFDMSDDFHISIGVVYII